MVDTFAVKSNFFTDFENNDATIIFNKFTNSGEVLLRDGSTGIPYVFEILWSFLEFITPKFYSYPWKGFLTKLRD